MKELLHYRAPNSVIDSEIERQSTVSYFRLIIEIVFVGLTINHLKTY